MMNVLAISLVLTTLVTAGVFSPNPEKKEDVIVKEGHRVVVVEYEPNDGNTKVSISPQETAKNRYVSDKLSDKGEEVKENVGFHRPNARELVCDAFGKCRHKIVSALGGTKDTVSEKTHDAAEKLHEIEQDAKEAVGTAYEKVEDTVVGKAHEATEKASEVKDTVVGKAHEATEKASEVKDTVVGKAHEATEKASEVKEKTKEYVGETVDEVKETAEKVKGRVVDTTETLTSHLKGNASEVLDIIEQKGKEARDAVKEDTNRLKVEGKKIIRRFFSDVSGYILSAKNFRPLMGMIHLLGFSLSYGVCVWVTFISSDLLARTLPKQQFAMVQSKIYPIYFRTMSYGVASAFLGHYLSQKHRYYANWTEKMQGLIFLASFSMTMLNSYLLEPQATKVMTQRMKLEKEEGRGKDVFNVEPSISNVDAFKDPSWIHTGEKTTGEPLETLQELSEGTARMKPQVERLGQRLKKLNIISSFLNVLTLMALSYHLVYLSQLVHSSSY